MLFLIRDTIVTPEGYLVLFLDREWTPISFHQESDSVIEKHHNLDHVSFGHDVETAYLMIEASTVLGITADSTTHRVAKRNGGSCTEKWVGTGRRNEHLIVDVETVSERYASVL